jgi:hypothetical protein
MLNQSLQAVRSTRGASLIVTLGLMLVLLLLAAGVAKLVQIFMLTTGQVERANIAYYAAEAGVEQALYDATAYRDGYEYSPEQSVCDTDPASKQLFKNLNLNTELDNYSSRCDADQPYRFANFTPGAAGWSETHPLSGGRGFWRIFSRTMTDKDTGKYIIPNPYFAENDTATESKDGVLELSEWGTLLKERPFSMSLMSDSGEISKLDPKDRFTYLSDNATETEIVIFIDPDEAASWSPDDSARTPAAGRTSSDEDVFAWTLSAVDGLGEEYTLQGVVWESDFTECNASGVQESGGAYPCFILDFRQNTVLLSGTGHPLGGEDINKNLAHATARTNTFNRVSAITEDFEQATPADFVREMNDRLSGSDTTRRWRNVRLTLNLIGTLSESSGLPSDSLRYRLTSIEQLPDEYIYIVSEGYAGAVKQTIETRFRRQATIPVFSYVIFQ